MACVKAEERQRNKHYISKGEGCGRVDTGGAHEEESAREGTVVAAQCVTRL